MSSTASPYTTVAALKAADRIIGPNRVWTPTNGPQENWLAKTYRPGTEEVAGIPEIISNATRDASEHVAFLKKHGWDALITKLGPDEFATAGLLNVLVEWVQEGERCSIYNGNDTYPGVNIGKDNVEIFKTNFHDQPVVCLKTKTGDMVWLTVVENAPAPDTLVDLAAKLFRSVDPSLDPGIRAVYDDVTGAYSEGVVFPMVDLSTKRSLDALVDLWTTAEDGRRATVAEAVQQTTLKMNRKGARARAADEMRMTLECCGPMPLMIDKPFLLAIDRPGLSQPLFVAHVTTADWKDPGDL